MTGAERQAQKSLSAIEKQAYAFGKNLGVGLKIAGTAAASAGVILGGIYLKNTIAAEKSASQLNATLKALGGSASVSGKQIQGWAEEYQKITTFDDEGIQDAATALIKFTNVGADQFARALAASLDLAAASGDDLTVSAEKLGKALNAPAQAAKLLREDGIALTDSQKELIKTLTETGRIGEAQAIILGELEKRYKGAAEAARNTLGGSLESLKNSFNNLLEGDSGSDGLKAATEAVNDFSDQLNDPDIKQGVDSTVAGIARIAGASVELIAKLANAGSALNEFFGDASKRSKTVLENQKRELETREFGQARIAKNTMYVPGLGALNKAALEDTQAKLREINNELALISKYGEGRKPLNVLFSDEGSIPESMLRGKGSKGGGSGSGSGSSTKSVNDNTEALRKNAEALRESILAVTDFDQAQIDAETNQQDWARALEDLTAEMAGPAAEAQLAYARQMADVNAALVTGSISAEDRVKWEQMLGDQLATNVANAEDYGDALDALTANEAAMESLGYAFENAFASIGDGASSAKEIVGDFFDSIYQDALKWLAMQARLAVFGDTSTGQGGLIDLFTSFGGGMATGGTALPGKFYQVNENGPEMFSVGAKDYLMMGNSAGKITPNHKLGGGTINQTLNFSLAAPERQSTQQQIASRTAFELEQVRRRNS
jgi:hypothetical protein